MLLLVRDNGLGTLSSQVWIKHKACSSHATFTSTP